MLTENEFGDWFDKNASYDEAYAAAWATYQAFNEVDDESLSALERIARLELSRDMLNVKIAYAKLQASLEVVCSLAVAQTIMWIRHPISSESDEESIGLVANALADGSINYDRFNAISEMFPAFFKAIAMIENVTLGQLRTYAIDGKLTTEFIASRLQQLPKPK